MIVQDAIFVTLDDAISFYGNHSHYYDERVNNVYLPIIIVIIISLQSGGLYCKNMIRCIFS